MRLVALLNAHVSDHDGPYDESRAHVIRLGIQTPIEFQARQAIIAGADALIIHHAVPDSGLAALANRLARETEIEVLLVSDGPALARALETDDQVLMIAGNMIVPQDALVQLLAAQAPALLVTPTVPVTAHFERIDGQQVWAGAGLVPATLVLSTIDMLGEWDLFLTLLRRAVQEGAKRLVLPPDLVSAGRLLQLNDQADADRALTAQLGGRAAGGGLTGLLAPLRRLLVAELARREITPNWINFSAAGCAVAGLAAVSWGWATLALLLALLSEAARSVGRASAEAMLRRPPGLWQGLLVEGSGLALLAIVGGRLAKGDPLALTGVFLPLALVALLSIARLGRPAGPVSGDWRVWTQLTSVIALVVVLAGSLVGATSQAFLLIGLLAIGSVAVQLRIGENGEFSRF